MTAHDGIVASVLCIVALNAWSAAAPAQAGQPAPQQVPTRQAAPDRLSAAQRAAAIRDIQAEIQKAYVFPGKRKVIVSALNQAQRAGRYDIDGASLFAEAVTADLRAAGDDEHLYLRYEPAWYAAATAPAGSEHDDGVDFERQLAAQDHHGLREMRLLLGNVRYLRITAFSWVLDETGAAYDDAMRFLRDGDALIIDLRGNTGGSSSATQYLVSHFLDENVLLYTFESQQEPSWQSRTLGYLPAGRLKGKPLYVLTDRRTRSAGEDVAYQVSQYKLGELVGTTTAGAANNNEHVPVAPGFRLSVSVGRPVHPVSGGNWEGEGVKPTVEAPAAQAFEIAYSLALERLEKNGAAPPDLRAEYSWARAGAQARLHPVSISEPQLRSLAGKAGPVSVAFRDGALWMTRPNRDPEHLVPMTGDGMFSVEGIDELRVRITPQALMLYLLGDPEPRTYPRS